MAASLPQVVLFGDSLFQQSVDLQDGFSFQAALQQKVIRRLDVVNRGHSGWTTRWTLKYMDQMLPEPTAASPKIAYFLLLLGANDAIRPVPGFTTQHVPIEEYKKNLNKIIHHPTIEAHKPKILLVTPPPVDEIKIFGYDAAAGLSSSTRTSAISASYSQKVREVAQENPGVVLIDLWQAIMDKAISMTPDDYQPGGPWLGSPENGSAGGLHTLLPDGLHMAGDAYRVFYDLVSPHIGEQWVGLPEDDRSGYMFPDWRDFK